MVRLCTVIVMAVWLGLAGCEGGADFKPEDWAKREFHFEAPDRGVEIVAVLDGVTFAQKSWVERGPVTPEDRAVIQAQIQRVADERKAALATVGGYADKVLDKALSGGLKGILP